MLNKKKIIIGTSGWGSKISYNKSLEIGKKLISLGINQFDTAPTYGGGCAHQILNNLSINNKTLINTKYGEITKLSLKEIIKRIYRFHNFNTFKRSYDFVKVDKKIRFDKNFWNIENIEKYLIKVKQDINNCDIKILYLHSPPYEILNKEYLNDFIELTNIYNILPGVSWPDHRDLRLLLNNFPHIMLQISLNTFNDLNLDDVHKAKSITINSIFKDNYKNNKVRQSKFGEEIIDFLKLNENHNLVLGINSNNSIKSLNELLINV